MARLACLLVVCSACTEEEVPLTQLVIVSNSDIVVPTVMDDVRVTVFAPDGNDHLRNQPLTGDEAQPLPVTLTLVHAAGPTGLVDVTVSGYRGDRFLVERRARTSFLRGEILSLRMDLTANCVGVRCEDADETCVDAVCRDVDIHPGSLTPFEGEPEPLQPVAIMTPGPDASTGDESSNPTNGDEVLSEASEGGTPPEEDASSPMTPVTDGSTEPATDAGMSTEPDPDAAEPCDDVDNDGTCDHVDDCVDVDGDGIGIAPVGTGCKLAFIDSDDSNPLLCGDFDGDGCNDCGSGMYDPSQDGTDTDGDGVCDETDGCNDEDGDGLGDGSLGNVDCITPVVDEFPTNPNLCSDKDGDGCDDCLSGEFDLVADGPDADGDAICDTTDDCTDADGDGLGNGNLGNAGCDDPTLDEDDEVATACADTDGDGCDDCSNGSFDAGNDGADGDTDGICDVGDGCTDADLDGLGNGTGGNATCIDPTTDSLDTDPEVCADTDGDLCDDCSKGSFDPSGDGADSDGDGLCDVTDVFQCLDTDGDGLGNGVGLNNGCIDITTDSHPEDPNRCADTDGDGCDDCSSGTFNANDDGPDADGDGACDLIDNCTDADGDGLGNGNLGNVGCINTATDTDDDAPNTCGDSDLDGCDDCALGAFNPADDGTDVDGDGICDVTDCDDSKPQCTFDCTDADGDGFCGANDCDDTIPTCNTDCMNNSDFAEAIAVIDCVETYCGSDPSDPLSVCTVVNTDAALDTAIQGANAGTVGSILIDADITVSVALPALLAADVKIRGRTDATLTVQDGGAGLRIVGNAVSVQGLNLVGTADVDTGIRVDGSGVQIRDNVISGFNLRGVQLIGGSFNKVTGNRIHNTLAGAGDDQAALVLMGTTGTEVSGNLLTNNASDGLQIRGATGPFVDHNTIASNTRDGIQVYGEASTGLCVRNNIVALNAGNALNFVQVASTFDTSNSCTGPLPSGPVVYGNNTHLNTRECAVDNCAACACAPANFFSSNVDPKFASIDDSEAIAYCPGPSTLIDAAADLSYDRNGAALGNFAGSGPETGGREATVYPCP